MLVIRREQMEAFNCNALKGFEDRMVRYLTGRFPDACGAREEQSVRETIRNGIARSEGYGITSEYDVARYIELMYRLSEDFDTNPDTDWAAYILESSDLGPGVKMDELCKMADRETSDAGTNDFWED